MRTRRTAAVFQAEFPVPCRHTGSHRRTEWYRQDQSPASSCRFNAAAGRLILWKNEPIKKLKEEFWKDLVYIGHLNGVKDELTARENLLINCEIGEHPVTKEQADHALAMVGLEGFEDHYTRHLSQGQRRRVALARLYLSRHAGFWVLDEPSRLWMLKL